MDHPRKRHALTPSHIAYALLGSFLAALFLLQWHQRAFYPWPLWTGALLPAVIGALYSKARRALCIASSVGIFCALGAVMRTTHVETVNTPDHYAQQSVVVEATVGGPPDIRDYDVRYTLHAKQLTTASGGTLQVSGNILAIDRAGWPLYAPGDSVRATGTLERPEAFDTFAYDRYLSRYGIYVLMRGARLTLIAPRDHVSVSALLQQSRESVEAQINALFPEPHAALLTGLLTGVRRGLPDDILEDFRRTGLTHILAISGYNITIILALAGSALFFLPFRRRLPFAVIAVTAFVLFVGAGSPVVRAAIMGVIGLLALQTGRPYHARLALLWSASIMLWFNPKLLWYDAGFQLSFLAVAGLTETGADIQRWCRFLPQRFAIREAFATTLAAQIAVVPWSVLQFQSLSLIAPLANIAVAPLIPPAMLLGALSVLGGMIFSPLGMLLCIPAWLLLEAIVRINALLAAVPGASVGIAWLNTAWLAAYYLLLIAGLWLRQQARHKPLPQPTIVA